MILLELYRKEAEKTENREKSKERTEKGYGRIFLLVLNELIR